MAPPEWTWRDVKPRTTVTYTWWGSILKFQYAVWLWQRGYAVQWLMCQCINWRYPEITQDGWWEVLVTETVQCVIGRLLSVPPVAWILARFGVRLYQVSLGITNRLRCAFCYADADACQCGDRDLEIYATDFDINGATTNYYDFMEEYARFRERQGHGLILERV